MRALAGLRSNPDDWRVTFPRAEQPIPAAQHGSANVGAMRHPSQVIRRVIAWVAVDVVNLVATIDRLHERQRNKAVHVAAHGLAVRSAQRLPTVSPRIASGTQDAPRKPSRQDETCPCDNIAWKTGDW